MNKLLCIVGPTGTRKTARALEMAKEQPSVLISADSRQVYRGMDIVTGKDHPRDIAIYGIDVVEPDESCSVSVWYDAVMPKIERAWGERKLPIVVGGTGLYVKALTMGIQTMHIPINHALRDKLETLSVSELQTKLQEENSAKFSSLNHSDQNNPRRLIRAIEVSQSSHQSLTIGPLPSAKLIGLKYFDYSNYRSIVHKRVLIRLSQGAIEETKFLLKKYNKDIQSMSAIGYRSIIKFLEKSLTEEEMIKTWVEGELAYAKRQLTWFRKQSVIWYDVDTYGITQN
ncbi:MAG: tRNA (adenosine(37)-N6)-dimethylallyltransferase MiaA [bacterium]